MIRFTGSEKVLNKDNQEIQSFLKEYKPHFLSTLNDSSKLSELQKIGTNLGNGGDTLCVVGLGGSSLGSKALYEAIDFSSSNKKIIFFDNIDSYQIEKNLNQIDFESCHWLFVSKSGGTQEVQALINFLSQAYQSSNLEIKDRSTVLTTLNDNPIHQWAQENNISSYAIPEEVGGRFSVFTSCGLIPMAFMGLDLNKLKKGAKWGLTQDKLIASLSDELLHSFAREEWVHLYWSYSDSLINFCFWLQQLWMESLGKEKSLDGTPAVRVSSLFTARGASDQHSILQQISEGFKDKLVVFLEDGRSQSGGKLLKSSLFSSQDQLVGQSIGRLLQIEKQGTLESLKEKNISCLNLHLTNMSAESMAALMTIYMVVTVTIADRLKIDPFDQPGVESSKMKTKEILSRLNPEVFLK